MTGPDLGAASDAITTLALQLIATRRQAFTGSVTTDVGVTVTVVAVADPELGRRIMAIAGEHLPDRTDLDVRSAQYRIELDGGAGDG